MILQVSDNTPANSAENMVRRRIARLKRLQQRYSGYSSIFSTIRALVAVVFVGLVFSRISSEESWLVNGVLFLLMALFALLVFRQSKVKRKIADLTTLINYAETDISRIHLDWGNIPVKSTRFQSNTEVARDLKIAGERSLVHLTDTTSSIEARDYLLELLLNSNPNTDDIEYRQNLIQSLVPKHLLFARLRLAGGKMDEKELSGDAIVALLEGSTYPRWGKVLLWASAALAVINIVLLFAFGLKYFLLPFILYVLIFALFNLYSGSAYANIVEVSVYLQRLKAIFGVLEERVDSEPILAQHFAPLRDHSSPARFTSNFSRYANALSVRAFAPAHLFLNALLPWDQYYTYKLESIRQELLDNFKVWLEVTNQTEAYCALAHFARLNPSYCLPAFIEQGSSDQVKYDAKDLGHPLMTYAERITNDFELSDSHRIAVVTGSNMAGKSAFLRTIGINHCLAQAGSVVCATAYKAVCFRVVSCIDVTDDLDSGKSLFYVEIEKLKYILDSFTESHSTLFLIDEILKGTNNRERIVGGKKYLRSLGSKGGYGLVSSHDLEFANLADEVAGMFNVHFQETVIDDKMIFDHKLRMGRSQSTNALRIMEINNLI